jgi:O-6-methylguanine DNA methyltransferase
VRSLKKLSYGFATTPLGDWGALTTETHLVALYFARNRKATLAEFQARHPKVILTPCPKAQEMIQLAFEYPEAIPVLSVGTPFQLTVWEFLRSIPRSSTLTYGEVAGAIGHPKSARPVGQAIGANEISVVIPCHRVVSRGKLTGYRWGIDCKRRLLAHELPVKVLGS